MTPMWKESGKRTVPATESFSTKRAQCSGPRGQKQESGKENVALRKFFFLGELQFGGNNK